MNSLDKALELSNLTYHYRHQWTGQKILTLKGLTLDVFAGEAFGFLGHNGAGKTTTIKCILRLVKLTGGSAKIFGRDCSDSKSRTSVGYLPEQPYFYDHLTVAEMLDMYACLAGVDSRFRSQAVSKALEQVSMSGRRDSPMRSLSKGLTQRVAMAQAIVANPKLLILDEPFSGLDPIGRKEFRDLIFSLKKSGTTIFICSHILGDVEYICDRASIMVRGELKRVVDLKSLSDEAGGQYELVIGNPGDFATRLGVASEQQLSEGSSLRLKFAAKTQAEAALKAALDAKVTVESYQFVHGNLEDLFVEVVKGGTGAISE